MLREGKTLPIAILLGVAVATGGDIGLADLDPLGKASAVPAITAVGGQERLANEQNTIDIVQRYSPSVVAINVTVEGQRVNPLENLPPELRRFFRQFGQNTPFTPFSQPERVIERAAGSGFVVNEQGQIVTNYHVVAQALRSGSTKLKPNATITVNFRGQDRNLPVEVVGADQSYDLALLQLKHPKDRPADAIPIPLADSDKIMVGEKAIAIGNPFTLESTVTEGIVSAVNRRQAAQVSGVPIDFIQTDAAINPGNSGGPLLNSRGEVIGVNDEILAPNGTFVGVGLAIPSNLVQARLGDLQHGGLVKKAQIGIQIMSMADYPEKVRKFLNLPNQGVMVVAVAEDSPADKANLQPAQYAVTGSGQRWPVGGDIIVEVNGKTIESAEELQNIVYSKHAGDTLELTLLHDQETRTVRVKLAVLKQ
ncbi:MAG: trypsin-like peptidase domain-containing protein [Nitrococcus mobilis]|nr:trypsin-like peptidase domain-containing protein [Nitrococcus mobilis]